MGNEYRPIDIEAGGWGLTGGGGTGPRTSRAGGA
jgi:hypothetical protein